MEYKRNWSRLIQKIYEVDPLTCPKCQGRSKIPSLAGMGILAFIEDEEVIKKTLNHLGLWERKAQPPPKTSAPQPNAHIDKTDSQVPPCEDYFYCDPEYPIEAYAS